MSSQSEAKIGSKRSGVNALHIGADKMKKVIKRNNSRSPLRSAMSSDISRQNRLGRNDMTKIAKKLA